MILNNNIKLDYDFSKLLSADYSVSCTSCIKHQLYELPDIHEKYGGFPKSYCFENTKINQLWWDETQIDYAELGRQLGMEVVTVSTILQPPGCIIPYHRDMFHLIKQKFPDRTEPRVRANIYLEDYKLGHFLQYVDDQEVIHTCVDWKAGTGNMWDSDVLHLSGNAGMEDKYTLQISGFLLT